MKQGFLEIPDFALDIYNTQKKSGGRTEYSLKLTEELYDLGKKITDLPLRFASIVEAHPSTEDQQFHQDSESGERAIIYLTDVHETNGPIEFKTGKVLGPIGTFVHYPANEIHRGCASDIDRLALALAFNTEETEITTVGAATFPKECQQLQQGDFGCPEGRGFKNPLPPDVVDTVVTYPQLVNYCCTGGSSSGSTWWVWLIVGLIAVFLYTYMRR